MSARISFADLLKKGAEKEQKKNSENFLQPDIEKVELSTPPTPPTLRTLATSPTTTNNLPVSPARDFAKVANSIVRDAVAQGLFIGKSKQIYDYLYLQTRGAIQPARNVRITKSNLMLRSDIGSERTLLKNLAHLKSVGLIKIREFDGQHGGNEFEVFLPEESQITHPTPPTPPQPPHPLQKVGSLPPVESGVGGVGQIQVNKDTYSVPKTSFKDNTNDDEAFADFIDKFQAAAIEITGKKISIRDSENLKKIADLLVLELKMAARRTGDISSITAFLTEVLRRKLRGIPQETFKTTKTKIDTVGKSNGESFEIKALDQKGREAALEELREFAEDEFLQDFKRWYTEEDWQWLIKELAIEK